MSESKETENEQQEPGPPPAWMIWVGGEVKSVRTDLRADIKAVREEIKASEERQGELLRTELKVVRAEAKADLLGTENRLRKDLGQQIDRAVSRVTALFGVLMGFLVLLVTVLAVFFLQQDDDRNFAEAAAPPTEVVAQAPEAATPSAAAQARPTQTGASAPAAAPLPEPTQAVAARAGTEAEGPGE